MRSQASIRVSPAVAWAAKFNLDKSEQRSNDTPLSRLLIVAKKNSSSGSSFLGEAGDFISKIVGHYSSTPHSYTVSGIKVDYAIGASLLYLEGETSSLCALVRELHEGQSEIHGFSARDTRVLVYQPEAAVRFFTAFYDARVDARVSKEKNSGQGPISPPTDQPLSLEERLMESGEAIDLFVRLLAAKVESLPDQEAKQEALTNMVGLLAISPPSGQMLLDLATQISLPPVDAFVKEFDIEFIRYQEILEEEGELDMSIPEVQRLDFLYKTHLKREIKAAEDQEAKSLASLRASSPLSRFYPVNPSSSSPSRA